MMTIVIFVTMIFRLYLFSICWPTEQCLLSLSPLHQLDLYYRPFHWWRRHDGIFYHQSCSYKSFKTLIHQQWKDDEFERPGLVLAGAVVRIVRAVVVYFSSTTIRTFIKTVVVSHLKWLNLPLNNEKLMSLGHPGLLLLLASIFVCSIFAIFFFHQQW